MSADPIQVASAGDGDIAAPFWQALREHRLMLQVDAASGRAQFPPRPQSLYGEAGVRWVQASGRGTLVAVTTSRIAAVGKGTDPVAARPRALALVRLDEGPRLMATVEAPFEALHVGLAVEIDWGAGGSASPFPVFRPVADPAAGSS